MDEADRRIELQGCFNFRDLGGYTTKDGRTVRWRRLFRSDSLNHLTDTDAAFVRDELGVRTLLDLRTDIERDAHDLGPLESTPIDCHHISLINPVPTDSREVEIPPSLLRTTMDRSPAATAERYGYILRNAGPGLVRAIGILLDGLPGVFYCAAGKDRTGLLAAIVLGAIGVPDDVIVDDYVLTEQYIDAIIDRLRASQTYARSLDDSGYGFAPHADTMHMVLDELHADFGTIPHYLKAQGAPDGLVDRMREELLVRAGV